MKRVEHPPLARLIEEEASRCLYCGFCEALCPTRPLGLHRGYGPRGRVNIALMIARGEVGFSQATVESLYTCLLCGACELKCPAKIRIVDVIRAGRALYADRAGRYSRGGSQTGTGAFLGKSVTVGVSESA